MKRLHIFNPASGGGHSPELLTKGAANGEEHYVTSGVGDAESFVYNTCLERPETHFIVYGGDGTINEAANGIIRAGAGMKCLMSVVPAGTGNDFIRTFPEKDRVFTIDAMKYRYFADENFCEQLGERFAVNILNFGFDSHVVMKTAKYKKIFAGGVSYIAGLADTLCRKMGERWSLSFVDELGNSESYDDEFTLTLAANCRYYGGGFRAAPLASPSDGLIDLLSVKKVSKSTFIKLVGDYKKGSHLDPVTQKPYDRFSEYVIYRRCKSIKLSGIADLCCDGELAEARSVEVESVPSVIRIAT